MKQDMMYELNCNCGKETKNKRKTTGDNVQKTGNKWAIDIIYEASKKEGETQYKRP